MEAFKSFSAQLTPLASRMQHTLDQAKQYAAEKIGNAESTPFSSEYTRIMEQFDKQVNVLAQYHAYLKHYVANEYNAPLRDEVKQENEHANWIRGDIPLSGVHSS